MLLSPGRNFACIHIRMEDQQKTNLWELGPGDRELERKGVRTWESTHVGPAVGDRDTLGTEVEVVWGRENVAMH